MREPTHFPVPLFTKARAEPISRILIKVTTVTDTTRYAKAEAMAWDRMHPRLTHRGPRLTHRGPWRDHTEEELPILHRTLIRLKVERLPGDRDPNPVWLWCSSTAATPADVDR